MLEIWKQTWGLLDSKSQRQYVFLILFSCVSSLVQAVGISSIPIFFTVLIEGQLPKIVPSYIQSWTILELGLAVFILLVSGSVMSAAATFYGIKVAWTQYPRIASRVLRQFLDNRYEWHIGENSSELGKIVLVETHNVVLFILQQLVMLIVKGSELVLISSVLLLAKPLVALTSAGSFFAIYFLLYSLNKKFIIAQGETLVESNTERHRTTNEALSAIKTVKAYHCEDFFVNLFDTAAKSYSQATSNIQYFSLLPKYFIEVIIYGGLVGFVVVSELRTWQTYESIPLITMYGAAAIRLLPGLQQCYFSAASITSSWPSLKTLVAALNDLRSDRGSNFTEAHGSDVLRFENVSYIYPGSSKPSLEDLSFQVKSGDKIGIVGVTGAGKTTMVDLLLGLLEPSAGRIVIKEEHANSVADYVGYVPQTVNFVDATIAENIALGQQPSSFDHQRMQKAANDARIHEHISSLPEGYSTQMGEQGVRLSGGQRQRIGIARALYRQPELLVLDEASSALDASTEKDLFTSLLRDELTLIVIAHRLSVLKSCTQILLLNEGRLVAQGTYDQLMTVSPLFAKLAQSQAEWAKTEETFA